MIAAISITRYPGEVMRIVAGSCVFVLDLVWSLLLPFVLFEYRFPRSQDSIHRLMPSLLTPRRRSNPRSTRPQYPPPNIQVFLIVHVHPQSITQPQQTPHISVESQRSTILPKPDPPQNQNLIPFHHRLHPKQPYHTGLASQPFRSSGC